MAASSIIDWLSRVDTARLRELLAGNAETCAPWVRVLALEGLPAAQLCYGRMLLAGTGVEKNACEALTWFRRAAAMDDLDAVNMVGRCLENGWGADPDTPQAAAHFHRAADAGHAWAQYNLGHLYLGGIGVERSAHRAFSYYRRAAAQDHPRAMNLVARCCEEGWGTPVDFTAAAGWYERSAQAGYFRGQYNWASILLKARRPAEAASWFERAVGSGLQSIREAVLSIAASAESPPPMTALADRLRRQSCKIGA